MTGESEDCLLSLIKLGAPSVSNEQHTSQSVTGLD